MRTSVKWTSQEDNLLREKYQARTPDILQFFPGRSHDAIILHAEKLGIKKERNFYIETNCEFLLENTPESFYWIGFILADGHISKLSRLKVLVSNKDEDFIKVLSNKLNVEIKHQTKEQGIYSYFSCMDKFNLTKLSEKFDIHNNKTENPPRTFYGFDDELLLSLIVGMIDGDGCIKHQYKRTDHVIDFHCHSNWLNYYNEIHDFLQNITKVKMKPPKIGKDGYLRWTIANHTVVNFLKRFGLENNLPIMKRKWDLIDLDRKYRTDGAKILQEFILNNKNMSIQEICESLNTNYGRVYSSRKLLEKKGLL